MFKYTPKKEILRELTVRRTPGTCWWEIAFRKQTEVLKRFGLNDYQARVVLETDYHTTCRYSPKRLREVPVRGILFPVEMFNEEVEK